MSYAFVWIVLWLNTGAPDLVPEQHSAMIPDGSCDDREAIGAAYRDVLNHAQNIKQIVGGEVWCDEEATPAMPVPGAKPPEHIPGKGET